MKFLNIKMRYFLFCLIFLFILSQCIYAASPDAPNNLRCCDKTNPVGTDSKPYFGWYVNDPDNDEIQTSYQILIASSQSNLDKNNGDIWDSGRETSRKQNCIFYEGHKLTSGTRYFWKVRTWDKDGNVSPFSDTAIFDTGLFTCEDWANAKWIKRNSNVPDDYTYFRKKTIIPDKIIERAIVYVTAYHNYELYIDEKLIGKGPAYHYPQYQYYNAYDITSALSTNSENIFACLTHWYGGGQGRSSGNRGFLLKAVIEFSDSTSLIIGTDNTWKQIQATSRLTGQRQRNGEGVGYIEKIDARKIIKKWNALTFNDSSWSSAVEIGSPPVAPWINNLQPDLTRLIEEEITPVSINNLGGGKYVIDFGKVYAGVPVITFSGTAAGTTINMRGGYTLNDEQEVSSRTTQNTDMSYYFIHDSDTSVFKPHVYLGMRYFQVDNSPNVLTNSNVKFIKRYYELDSSRSSFSSSDSMLNQVWKLMKHSLTLGAQEQFVDTPTREKGGFLGDGWSQGTAAMSTMGERAMNLRVLLEFLDSQDQYWPDGRLNAVYPNSDGARDIPDYTQSYLVWVWDYYMQSGNSEFLKDNYNRLKKVADYVYRYRNETTGLIQNLAGGGGSYRYGIIDWPENMRYGYDVSTESRTVIDAYAYIDFSIISQIAEVLGNTADRDAYRNMARDMADAINSKLLNDRGVYVDGLLANKSQSLHVSQQANMLPLAFGIVPEENIEPVIAKIKELKMSVGMVTLRWLLEAVGQADQGTHLLELYTNTNWDGWAKTIELGATATWESWDAHITGQSMSHPWGTVGLPGIQKYILGIEPLKSQHEEVQIKPLEFNRKLTFANGTLPTDRGDITVSWERNDENFSMTVTIPDNVTARVYVPKCGTEEAGIKIDGIDTTGILEGNYVFAGNFGSGIHTFIRTAR